MVSTFARRAARFGIAAALLLGGPPAVRAATSYKQPSFHETVVFSGLTNPAVVRFLPDGRVVVAEKSGLIKLFDSLTDPTPTVVADLRTQVHNFWDRGLLGLAVDPHFATNNFIYVLYAHDAAIGATAPRWGTAGATSDPCPTPPGATGDGCVISGHLSRLTATGTDWTASEQVLIEDWCQQYPSHSTGSLAFGADGYLYVTGGDGASFNAADWGQFGGSAGSPTPANPCGDPPFALGTPQTKPTAEGGALRSQSPRRTAGEPRLLNGALLRVDPATGLAAPDNPLASSADLNERRIVGYGLRNPFRMIVKPGTSEVWIADVGWNTWEELNRLPDVSTVRNFGWPCYEGNGTQYTGLTICPSSIAQTTTPFYTYNHGASVVAGDGCTVGSSSVAGMAFYQGGSNYPPGYAGALFFSDYSRKCLWVMFPGTGGDPDPTNRAAFAAAAQGPVDLQIGPDGNLYYADFDGGRVLRVEYGPVAAASGAPLSGIAPLTVNFSSAGSAPAQAGDTIAYAWDLDGDGEYDDSTLANPSFLYTDPGTYTVRLKVTDNHGASNVSSPLTVSAGNTAPTAVIDTPLSSLTWQVNDTISFSGHATDPQQGALPASALSWVVLIQHCPSNCHSHVYQTFDGVDSGSFPAPDHEYPAHLEIRLTAKDGGDLTNEASVSIQPQTVDLSFQTVPAGRQLTVGTFTGTAPFTRTVIRNSSNGVDALAPQGTFPDVWDFASWSDAGAEQHAITATATAAYTASYVRHADLSIAAAASPEPVGAGANLAYTVNVANAGPSQATALSVGVTLPAGSSFVSASGAGWSCTGTGPVTCTLPSLGIAAAPPISVVVTAPPEAGPIGNAVSVTSSTSDAATANNGASTSSTVFARADLSVAQSGAPASICTGQPIAYTLAVSNAGPSTATSVTVTDTLPAGASLVSASGAGWTCGGTTTVTCTRPSLAVGAAPPITVTTNAPASAGTAINAAAVASAVNDPSAGNDASNASTTVNAVPSAPAAGNGGAVCVGGTLQLTAPTVAGATYAWTGPNGFASSQQNPTIANAPLAAAGTYSVTVTVASCTSAAGTTVATVHPLPTAAVSGGGAVCAGGSVAIQAALTGAAPWNLVWSDGFAQNGIAASPATRSVSPGATTTYAVTSVSDAHCAGSGGSGSALVTINPRPTAAAGGTAEICAGASTPLTGAGGVACSWTPATGLSNPSSCAPNAAPAATTTYTLTVTDASGCVSNNAPSVTVTVQPRPTAAVSGSTSICAGGSALIQAALTGAGPWNLVWSDGFAQNGVAASPATRAVSPGATTAYSVTSVADAHCAGTASGGALVTLKPLPTATVSGSSEICAGASAAIQAALTGTGPWTVTWSDGLTQSGVATSPAARSVSPGATTTYTVTSVSDSSCAGGAGGGSALVTVHPQPAAVAGGSAAICVGGSTPLSGSGGASCSWAPATGLSSASSCTSTASPASTTTYTLTVTSADGCVSTNAPTVTVSVHPKPTATVSGSAAVCGGASAAIQAALTGAGPWTLVWSDGVTQSNVASSPATRSVSPGTTTTYSVTSVADTRCTGTSSGGALVTVQPLPTAAVSGGAEICAGLSTTIQAALTGTGPWTLVWSDGVTQSNVAASPAARSVSPAATTSYTVTAVSDASCAGGAGSGSATVTVDPRPGAVAAGSTSICPGGSAPLSGSGGASCLWAPATGLSNASSCTPTATPSATTVYTLTVTSAEGCTSTNAPAVTVTVNPTPPAPTASNNGPVCAGESLQLSASGAPGAAYSWTGPNGFTANVANPAIPGVTDAASGLYSVTVSIDGCPSTATSTTVLVRPLPTALVSGSATVCAGGSTDLTAVLTGTGPWTLVWSDGVIQNTSTSPAVRTVSPASTTTYFVASVTDAHCASAGSGSAEVIVRDPVEPPTITVSLWAAVGASGLAASAPAHDGSTYAWTLTGGSIASGQGTSAITFDAGAPGTTMELSVVETDAGCVSPASSRPIQVDFLDVAPDHRFHDFVDTLARNGVTAGCGGGKFCPDASNSRAQMAVFVLKSKFGEDHVPPDAVGIFADVAAADPFAPWIEEAASLQITVGCGGGNFCPSAPVTRGQMAVILLKALLGFDYAPPPPTGTLFADVPEGAFAAAWIEDLYSRGVTGGCLASPLMYCPATPVTRGQMAVFLVKTFGLE